MTPEYTLQTLNELLQELSAQSTSNPAQFFKTEQGAYGAHDKFLKIPNPTLKAVAKKCFHFSFDDIALLLHNEYNEKRLLALMILILQYQKGSQIKQEAIFTFYLENLTHINNWNLVDCSAHLILGAHLYTKHHDILYTFAQSDHLWTKRIAIIATLYFIRKASFETTLNLAKILLNDQHNLIHKAVGWMLREIGKKNEKVLQEFLQEHAPYMPRVMLAYAIEKLEPAMRKSYQAMKKIR